MRVVTASPIAKSVIAGQPVHVVMSTSMAE